MTLLHTACPRCGYLTIHPKGDIQMDPVIYQEIEQLRAANRELWEALRIAVEKLKWIDLEPWRELVGVLAKHKEDYHA